MIDEDGDFVAEHQGIVTALVVGLIVGILVCCLIYFGGES